MPVQQFLVAAGFGRTKLYDLLCSGELDSVVIGRRRLILMDSYRRLIERQRAPPLQDLKELPITAAQRKPPGPKAMPPERRRRPVARAARFENTNNNAAVNSRIHQPLQGWRTRTEILDTLGRSTALKVLSLHGDWRLIDLFDGQPTIIVKVSAGVPGARACVRIGELIEAGVRSRASRTGSRRCQQAR